MPLPSATALLLLVAGLLLGSFADEHRLRPPQRVGEHWLLTADFHVHGFPGDGSLPPWVLRDEAARAGLHLLALTNHNQTFSARVGASMAGGGSGSSGWPLLLVGEEITSARYHLAAIGLSAAVDASLDAVRAIAEIHRQGGIAIAAHPTRDFDGWTDEAIAALDGVEVAHPAMYTSDEERADLAAFFARAQRLNPDIAAIGSSDMHQMRTLGLCRTLIFARTPTRDGVLEAVRTGMTVAMDAGGRLHGRPDLIAQLPSDLPRRPSRGWLAQVAVMAVLAGILGVTILGRRRQSAPTPGGA